MCFLIGSPSAIQVELSPDSNMNSFRSLAPPALTAGCTKIRISTESFDSPVRMIRLHFKRPPDSTTLGMSQILLLGHNSLSNEQTSEDYRYVKVAMVARYKRSCKFFSDCGGCNSSITH